jgi:UDP-N-acetylmuramate--alanine ligase
MHIFISGILGSGLSSLAHFAIDCGIEVSGSDSAIQSKNPNFIALQKRGVNIFPQSNDIDYIIDVDWYIHSPAVPSTHPEIITCQQIGVKVTHQNEFLNHILLKKHLKMIAIAGTHGKTTTTGMLVWLFQQLKIPVSYIVGTNISFGESGKYEEGSEYFIYEADEYNKKFLELKPFHTITTNIDFDHADTYKSAEEYFECFAEFVPRGVTNVIFAEDLLKIGLKGAEGSYGEYRLSRSLTPFMQEIDSIQLAGRHNRENAYLCIYLMKIILQEFAHGQHVELELLFEAVSTFPGTRRRFESLTKGLFSDYAHHPTEISATIQLAKEYIYNSENPESKLIVVYQPHQNIRQYQSETQVGYRNCFADCDLVYWLPTYLTREDPSLEVLSPEYLSGLVRKPTVAVDELGDYLLRRIKKHLDQGDVVLLMGAGSIDEFVREKVGESF